MSLEDWDHRRTLDVIERVVEERRRQDNLWGQQNHRCDTYYTILGEEVGEVGKAICELLLAKKGSIADIKEELIQVAAVAVAMVESIERNGI